MLGVVSTAFYNAFLLIKQNLPSTIRLDTHRTFGAICKVALWCYIISYLLKFVKDKFVKRLFFYKLVAEVGIEPT